MAITPEQRKNRKNGIGGSDAAAILNKSNYASALDVYHDKCELFKRRETKSKQKDMDRGTNLEAIIAQRVSQELGVEIQNHDKETFWHPTQKYRYVHIDGYIPSMRKVLEIKTVDIWAPILKELGESGTDELPWDWYYQGCHGDDIIDAHFGSEGVVYAVAKTQVIDGNTEILDLNYWNYEKQPEVLKLMLESQDFFWHENVLKKVPPLGETKRKKSIPTESIVIANQDAIQIYKDAKEIQKEINKLHKALKDKKDALGKYMDEFQYLMDENDKLLVSWERQQMVRKAIEEKKYTVRKMLIK